MIGFPIEIQIGRRTIVVLGSRRRRKRRRAEAGRGQSVTRRGPSPALREPVWRLRYEIVSTQALVWLASAGRSSPLRPAVHRHLADSYGRLARYYEARHAGARARRLFARALWHAEQAGPENPPPAAALAMPVPAPWIVVDAIGRHLDGPEDAA